MIDDIAEDCGLDALTLVADPGVEYELSEPPDEDDEDEDEATTSIDQELPVLDNNNMCRGCGACCLHLGWPPFYSRTGKDPRWRRLVKKRPDLVPEVDRAADAWGIVVGVFSEGLAIPCVWYDESTRTCRNYEYRPDVCRDFEPGEEDCLRFRVAHRIDRRGYVNVYLPKRRTRDRSHCPPNSDRVPDR